MSYVSEKETRLHFIMTHIPFFGGLSGLAALGAIFWSYAFLPTRVSLIEVHDTKQDSLIEEIQRDNNQRRETLAGLLVTLKMIDDRTQRIEQHLINDHK